MIEQAKFTYSTLGKVFEKQINTIEDQAEKQIKAIQNQGRVKTIKKYTYMMKIVHQFQSEKKYLINS